MSEVGKKRPLPKQTPEDEEDDKEASPKRPALGFMFRPSPLHKATEGFVLKQPTLKASPSETAAPSDVTEPERQTSSLVQGGGFLKLNSEDIKPITITTPTIMLSGESSRSGRAANQMEPDSSSNHNSVGRENPFLQFLSTSSSSSQSFSALSTTGTRGFASAGPLTTSSKSETGNSSVGQRQEDADQPHSSETEADALHPTTSQVPFGCEPATAMFPEIQTPTGEEREKKIVQVPARLYVFDAVSHNWKEHGRGEVRLNDACQSEGLFQSRLVMRASGSYRVLLNTHLWAQMKCDKANQKSLRITAQDGKGNVSVFLIMGVAKDIQQLFTAIDRRIEALKINIKHSEGGAKEVQEYPAIRQKPSNSNSPSDEEDKESFLDEPNSSPDSSPETHTSRLRRVPIPDQSGTRTEEEKSEKDTEQSPECDSTQESTSSSCM